MLMKLTPGTDFTNVLRAAVMPADPKSATRQSGHLCLLVLLGSACVKAAHQMLVKLTPGFGIHQLFGTKQRCIRSHYLVLMVNLLCHSVSPTKFCLTLPVNTARSQHVHLLPVIPNRGAATHKSAVKRCQGCRQISFFFSVLLLGSYKLFFLPGKGAAKFF